MKMKMKPLLLCFIFKNELLQNRWGRAIDFLSMRKEANRLTDGFHRSSSGEIETSISLFEHLSMPQIPKSAIFY
jgi:hypothetical protein